MICTTLSECLEFAKPKRVLAVSSPLGGLGVLALAQRVKLSVVTSGPVFNKVAVLEAMDNYGAEVRYAPRLHTALYKLEGDRECLAAGPPLVRSVALGNSTAVSIYSCSKVEGLEKLFTGGKPIEMLNSKVIGGGRDGRYFDVITRLRSLRVDKDDEEDIADWVIRSGAFDVDDPDAVSHLMWRLVSHLKNRSAVIFRDPVVGLGLTIPMVYYAVRVAATGQDCPQGRCIKTTAKLLERALRMAPPAKIHDEWRVALREPQTRRKIEESPYIPAVLMLTGKVEVKHDAATSSRLYIFSRSPADLSPGKA